MKHYKITYWLPKQSRLFSAPQVVIAKSPKQAHEIIHKIDKCGYVIEQVKEFDSNPVEERFYA